MWRNYFFQIQSKYNMRVSTKEPLVVRFDGKDVTKNKEINFLSIYNGSFTDALEKTVRYFTQKYHAFSIFGSDEVSFIFPEPMLLISDLDKENCNRSNEIIALFSQYFFNYFNSIYKNDTVFWHGKCFSIPKEKQNSYIKYRSGSIKNVMVTYFLKKKNIRSGNRNLADRLAQSKEFEDYKLLEDFENGILYFDGNKIDLKDYLEQNKITILKVELPEDIDYIDLSSF